MKLLSRVIFVSLFITQACATQPPLPGETDAWGNPKEIPGVWDDYDWLQNDHRSKSELAVLTLRHGELTTARNPKPQLKCVGGSAQGNYNPKRVSLKSVLFEIQKSEF